jgi:hypothetical protein
MKVLNWRTDKIPDGAVYVGRPTKWGNPYKIGRDGDRYEVIRKYEVWLPEQVKNGWLDMKELAGHDLVCWCAPKPCHADVLLKAAANLGEK